LWGFFYVCNYRRVGSNNSLILHELPKTSGWSTRLCCDIATTRKCNMSEEKRVADLLYGVPAIATYLGMRERQARHLVDRGIISSFKIGGTVCASRNVVDNWLAEKQAEAVRAQRAAVGRLPVHCATDRA
jgi:hypothetical protein